MKELIIPYRGKLPQGVQTELRAQRNTSRGVSMLSGKLVGNSRAESAGVSARICKNGVYGFASMAELSDEAVRKVLKGAEENALFMDRHIGKGKAARPAITSGPIDPQISWNDPQQKDYIDFLKEVDAYAAKKDGLASRGVIVRADSREKYILTSDGAEEHLAIPRSYVYIMMTAMTKEGVPVEMFKSIGGLGSFDQQFTDPALLFPKVDELYEQLMQKREGVYADAGLKTVILGGMMSGMLAHEAVGHTVEADLVLGGSIAATSLGKRVASDLVSMTDFAHTAFGKPAPLPVFGDDEGTPAVDAPLIKDGILVGYMNNRDTAEHFGTAPTGNARAYGYSDEPLIRMRNTAVHPGKDKLEDMIASVDDGYYLVDSGNGQADNTGEFMFGVTMGYEIKKGKLGRALLDTTVSGVAFEMLQTVDMVSDEIVWSSSGYCGKKQMMPVGMGGPALRCRITIGGR